MISKVVVCGAPEPHAGESSLAAKGLALNQVDDEISKTFTVFDIGSCNKVPVCIRRNLSPPGAFRSPLRFYKAD